MHSSEHRPWIVVYKVDYFILGALLSSLVLLNTRVVLSVYEAGEVQVESERSRISISSSRAGEN